MAIVRLTLPDHLNDDATKRVVVGRIVDQYKGCTMLRAQGAWRDASNCQFGIEDILVLETCVGVWSDETREWWLALCVDIRKWFQEDCVLMSVRPSEDSLVWANYTEEVGL